MRLAPRSRSPHGDLKTHSCCRLRDKRMMPIGSGWPMTLPRPPRPPTPLPPPPLPSCSTSNRPEPDVLPPVTIGGAGRRPAKNADRPRNQWRGCKAVVTHLPGEAKSPSPSPRPELDSVSHHPQQLHRLPVRHRHRMFAQPPPALAGRCLVHTTVGTSIRLGSGQQPSARRGSPAKMGEHCDRRPGCIPAPPIRPPIDAEVDSCGISPCGSVRAPSPPSRVMVASQDCQCHLPAMGSARVGFARWPHAVGVQTLRAEARAA